MRIAALLVAAGALAASPVFAAPPLPGTQVILGKPLVVCDAFDQTAEIAIAGQTSGAAMVAAFLAWRGRANAKGEPTCAYQATNVPMIAGEAVDLGVSHTQRGKPIRIWSLHVESAFVTWWVLWAEEMPPTI